MCVSKSVSVCGGGEGKPLEILTALPCRSPLPEDNPCW